MTLYTHAGALPAHQYVLVEPNALGNSMAVPCMAWIGKRIAEVDRGD